MRRYTHAIVKIPAETFEEGITNSMLGKPIYQDVLIQHKNYCKALENCGLSVIVLDPDTKFPDSCFVEDTAIITKRLAIITNPCSSSRQGEVEKISDLLSTKMRTIRITEGNLDGGDVMKVNDHYYIGISERTNKKGASQLSSILMNEGFTSSTIQVKEILHLKTGITHLNNNYYVATLKFSKAIRNAKIITTNDNEEYSANCLFINGNVIMSAGHPILKSELIKLKYQLIEVEMSEFQKMDGGLTCLSLIY